MKAVVILCLVLMALGSAWFYTSRQAEAKPNVVIILLDDMGFSDIGSYGGEIITPNIDKLAANGIRFTQAYNSARCWPTRASLLSGYQAQSIRRDAQMGQQQVPFGDRPAWARLIPQYLRPLGYRSYHSGKWNVDGEPLDNGFDHSYLNMNELGYFIGIHQELDGQELPLVEDDGDFYETLVTAQHAIDFLKDHESHHPGQPFFAYIAFNAPHFPLHALPQDIEVYKDRYRAGWDAIRQERLARMHELGVYRGELAPLDPAIVPAWNLSEAELKAQVSADEVGRAVPWNTLTPGEQAYQAQKMAVHAAMIHRVDIEIGRVMAQLEAMHALDNTLIFFLSDNGASAEQIIRGRGHDPTAAVGSPRSYLGIGPGWSSVSNAPFRLHKSWDHEGGIITPLIVQWPRKIAARGELRTSAVHVIDILPTILDVVGAEPAAVVAGRAVPPLPGLSLVPEFFRNGAVKHESLWWSHDGNRAVRVGDWKLVADHQSPWELYDLANDPSETRNLASKLPDKVRELEKAWTAQAEIYAAMASQ